MKHLNNCLSTNKISLNIEKLELINFKSPMKVLLDKMKIKFNRKKVASIKLNKISWCKD